MMPILATCLSPDTNASIVTVFGCIGELTFGSIVLAAIVFFIVMAYIMWKIGIPIQVTVPLSVILLAVLGGANYAANPTFTNLLLLFIMGIGILFAIAIIQFVRR